MGQIEEGHENLLREVLNRIFDYRVAYWSLLERTENMMAAIEHPDTDQRINNVMHVMLEMFAKQGRIGGDTSSERVIYGHEIFSPYCAVGSRACLSVSFRFLSDGRGVIGGFVAFGIAAKRIGDFIIGTCGAGGELLLNSHDVVESFLPGLVRGFELVQKVGRTSSKDNVPYMYVWEFRDGSKIQAYMYGNCIDIIHPDGTLVELSKYGDLGVWHKED